MSGPSGRPRRRLHTYAQGAAFLVAVLLVHFVLRPTEDPRSSATTEGEPAGAPSTSGGPDDVQPSGSPRRATDEELCAAFVRMAESQGRFVSEGEVGEDRLQEPADALVAVGVPASMSLGDTAFSAYLRQYCPA